MGEPVPAESTTRDQIDEKLQVVLRGLEEILTISNDLRERLWGNAPPPSGQKASPPRPVRQGWLGEIEDYLDTYRVLIAKSLEELRYMDNQSRGEPMAIPSNGTEREKDWGVRPYTVRPDYYPLLHREVRP